ncbi:G2/mitotic-specific cyclin S13-7-like [Carex rostrata]
MSKKIQLMEVLCNLLYRLSKRLSFIFLHCFFAFTKLFTKQVSFEKRTDPFEEYAEDIHSFYKLVEGESRTHNYFGSYSRITPRVRASLINLIVEVHQKLCLSPETLYLTVFIFDRFLSQECVVRVEAKLVGLCAMHIASKYEEVYKPLLEDFSDMWMLRYGTSDVLKMEKRILNRLEWCLSLPTPYMFLVRYIKIEKVDKETECMIFFFSELALMQHFLIELRPSLLAASCVYVARCTLKKNPLWTKTLQHCTRYSEPQLIECAQILRYAHSQAPKSIMNAVYNKYSHEMFRKVALYAPAEVEAWNN